MSDLHPIFAAALKGIAPVDQWQERTDREHEMERMLRSYIFDQSKRFSFGGIVNLLTTVAKIMEERSKLEDDDYQKAAEAIDDCADKVDLKYAEDE